MKAIIHSLDSLDVSVTNYNRKCALKSITEAINGKAINTEVINNDAINNEAI